MEEAYAVINWETHDVYGESYSFEEMSDLAYKHIGQNVFVSHTEDGEFIDYATYTKEVLASLGIE